MASPADPLGRDVMEENAGFAEQPGWGGGSRGVSCSGKLAHWQLFPLGKSLSAAGCPWAGLRAAGHGHRFGCPLASHRAAWATTHTGSPEAQRACASGFRQPVQPRPPTHTPPPWPQNRPLSPHPEAGTLGDNRNLKLLKDSSLFFEKEKFLGIHQMSSHSIKEGYRNLCFQDHKGNLMQELTHW